MKRFRASAILLLTAAGACLWLCVSPDRFSAASREITEAILQGRAWTFSTTGTQVMERKDANGGVLPLILKNNPVTAAVGDAVALLFRIENSAAAETTGGEIWTISTDVTAASEDAYLLFKSRTSGIVGEAARLDSTGLTGGLGAILPFPAGAAAAGGQKIGYEGPTGDTHGLRNPDTATLETTVDGTLATQERKNEWIPPDCLAGGPATFGAFCKDISTGKIKYRDSAGVKELP